MGSIRHFEGECNCADRMLTDCGCVAHVYGDGSGVDMQWCEQHSAGHAPAPLLISTLKLARSALDATIHAGPGYDPEMLVLMQGEAFRAIDAALAGETT